MPTTIHDRMTRLAGRTAGRAVDALRSRSRQPPARAIGRVIFEYARLHDSAFFVQVGAHDGTQLDPLQDEVVARPWRGIMVEPVPYVFERLRRRYGEEDRLILENVAISDADGERELHHLAPSEEGDEVWKWYDALGSFRREVVLSHRALIPDIDDRLITTIVPCLTFESLCARHGVDHIDIVQIDTEGYDWEILKQIDLDRYRPHLVMYENLHLDHETQARALDLLEGHGYDHISDGMDTLAVRLDVLARHPQLGRLWAELPAVAPPDDGHVEVPPGLRSRLRGRAKQTLETALRPYGYGLTELPGRRQALVDRSVPLPAGAEEWLTPENPRLLALSHSYEALDWPVVEHSRWRREHYEHWLDLRYFRGDNAYIWHYRESDALARLRFFVYLCYVEGLDGGRILERTVEDGAFGCFTYSFPGHPTCSRDLLDSVCELSFLDRHLALSRSTGTRVLDVGAGYGRLAHRGVEAFEGITDYCCVDAVPHSTFLSEFYIEARRCVPPARVVALPDVPSLEVGGFDLAVNVHSFSECTLDAIEWWLGELGRMEVPHLFVVPNEASGISSLEADGRRLDALTAFTAAGYRLVADEPAILDEAVRDVLGVADRHLLFERAV